MSQRRFALELCSPAELRAKPFASPDVEVVHLSREEHTRACILWTEVGRGFWAERSDWTDARWRAHLAGEGVAYFAAACSEADIGGFELTKSGDVVKLEGFGLLPAWRGRGLGAGLLTAATERAFAFGARRVWLETATDDHPHALPNYLARGYRVFRDEPLLDPMPPPRR